MFELRLPYQPLQPGARHASAVQVVLVSNGSEQPVSISDVSLEGMQLASKVALSAGDRVSIRLPDRTTVRAEVRWVRGDRAGLRFDEQISPWQLQAIVAKPLR
jgi:uncharacterized protein YabE (DUF348 family)